MTTVSVIVPCYNEEATIGLLLEAVYHQSFPHSELEVIIADGMSTDRTREVIAAFSATFPDLLIRIIDNPKRNIPSALNCALAEAQGRIIVRLDAHSMPQATYIAQSVKDLEAGLGSNVGGLWLIQPGNASWVAEAIAVAAAHPLAVGDAQYRYATTAGEVDTVPFGAFEKSLIDQIGGFDETLLTNEDYEFNTRIRKAGGKVWFNPSIKSIYFARSSLAALARQYWRYGYWKIQMLRRHPDTIRWRQALPPLFVAGLIFLATVGIFWRPSWWLLATVVSVYLMVLFISAFIAAIKSRRWFLLIGLPAAIGVMHFCWGAGFLFGIVSPPKLDR